VTDAAEQIEGFRISVQQQHLWRLREQDRPLWAQALIAIDGPLDADRLLAALDRALGRHEILRTSYHLAAGLRTPLQVVHRHREGDARRVWTTYGLQHLTAERQRDRIEQEARRRHEAPADPTPGPALSAVLFQLGPRRSSLLISISALAADSESLRLLVDELAAHYAAAPGAPLGDVMQYSEFAEWQYGLAGAGEATAADAMARRRSQAATMRFALQHDRDEAVTTKAAATVTTTVDAATTATPSVLLACMHVLLWKVTGQSDLTVGVGFAGRKYAEMADCLGHFAKWIGVRTRMRADLTFDDVVAMIERELSEAEELEEHILGSYAAKVTAWQAAFECKRTPQPRDVSGVSFTLERDDVEAEPYDLKLECVIGEKTLELIWHHRPERFAEAYIRLLSTQYLALLAGVLADPSTPVQRVSLLHPGARFELLERFNDSEIADPRSTLCIHELFEKQATRTPDAPAVADGTHEYSFRELDQRTNQLARVLRARGVGPEVPVAVRMEHSAHLLVALLAVLKAGGAYVPLDPALPWRRAEQLASQAGCAILLDRSELDRLAPEAAAADPTGLPPSATPENLAYIMFTSGSTGVPKGVMLPHRALTNYLRWSANTYTGDDGRGSLVHSPIAFDLTVTSLFVPLLTGRTVRIRQAWQDVVALSAELGEQSGLDLLKVTPSHLRVVNQLLPSARFAGTAGSLVLGGEALTREAVAPWRLHAPETRIFNEYGPTETAVGCCVHELRGEGDDAEATVPIGRPIANTEIYVLGADLEPVAVGVPGEIYVGGAGLARGYLGAPAATAARFVPHPFSRTPGARLYRTGDLACHAPDGELRFLGRLDDQVKIRGVRVEPAEVRAMLVRQPAVRDAVVLAEDRGAEGETRLAAYLIAADGRQLPTDQELGEFLGDRLPAYLVPDTYAWVAEFPLTGNGKLDRPALEKAATSGAASGSGDGPVRAPRDAVELTVVRVFEEVLGKAPIGVDQDFFDLGGHSLLAVQLIARLNAAFGQALPLSVLFDERERGEGADAGGPAVPAHLADLLRDGRRSDTPTPLVVLRSRGEQPPLFCVPPAGGDVLGYRELSLAPAIARPLYGLQAPRHDPADAQRQSIEFLAAHFLEAVRATRPSGPYLLLGWSMGGLVAYDMAERLARQGESVALILLESYLADQLPQDTHDVHAADARDEGPDGHAGDLMRAHHRAALAYRPPLFPGTVTLLQAADQDRNLRAAAEAAWSAVCTGGLRTRTLPGGHYSLLRSPLVDGLAQAIEDSLTGR
jgi:amino acid adenylation domain-containing protein